MEYVAKLLHKEEVTGGLLVFRLAKPQGYSFRAGQWCFLNLPDQGVADERGLRRHLSIASAPSEGELLFATKLSESAFKRTLKELPAGSEIRIEEPRGALALPEDPAGPVVLLAGGIGITPFRSLVRHAADANTGHRLALFYSSRTPEEALFLEEFQGLAAEGKLRLVASMTRMHLSSSPWSGATGRIDAALLRQGYDAWGEARCFLAGPPPMVDAMLAALQEVGVPAERTQAEKFAGY